MRPPITLPRTTVSAGLLEELLGEIPLLASVYHKPAETFVGQGRIGADSMQQRKGSECVHKNPCFQSDTNTTTNSPADDRLATQKALQTVAAGQQAENLLDFDDDIQNDGQPSGLAATTIFSQTPAAANLLAGTSSNPLDDLVSIFGNTSLTATPATPANGLGGFGFGGAPLTPAAPSITPTALSPQPPQQPAQSGQDDLLGLF